MAIDYPLIIANNQWIISWLLNDYSSITHWRHSSSISYVWTLLHRLKASSTFFEIFLSEHSLSQNKIRLKCVWAPEAMNSYFSRNALLISVPLKGIDIKMASPCKALNFGQNIFLRTEYVASWNNAQTWLLPRLFSYSYLSSFISKILDLLYWIVSIFIFDGVTVKTENSLQPNFTNIIWWTPGQRENSKMLQVMQILNGMGVLLLSLVIEISFYQKQRIYLDFSSLILKDQNFQICLLQS